MSFVNDRKTAQKAKEYVQSLSIKTPSVKQRVAYLSGGNQQKVAVAKWLAADCDVYIFDEPTKGVDVGAKQEIFHLINQIAKDGNCVIYATCENSELLSITDRMYVCLTEGSWQSLKQQKLLKMRSCIMPLVQQKDMQADIR
mgnify:CR=1 FL=1